MTRQDIADTIIELVKKDVEENLRETDGKNRSPRIDSFNERVGVPLGSPYCASAIWCAIDDACKLLNLKNPIPPTGWSQAFRRKSFVPEKYIKARSSLGNKGDVGVMQVTTDPQRGHLVLVAEDQKNTPKYDTYEYNTDGSGSRDGDGAYKMTRSTTGVSGKKIFICFTDVPQWILDANS